MAAQRVIVVGGGPAGLMAAGQAAVLGAETTLLEKMDRPGRKLLLTGKGRCNLTNVAQVSDFVKHFGPNGRFLRQAFSRFFRTELVAFFDDRGVSTVVERGGRIFPAADKAESVVDALVQWTRDRGVVTLNRSRADNLVVEGGRIVGVTVGGAERRDRVRSHASGDDGRFLAADAVIVATGGASYPGTGSTGDGYRLAQAVGHTIVPIRPALIPLDTAGDIAPRLEGLSLRNVKVRARIDGRVHAEAFGEMLFTHFGVSGPIILTMSRQVVDALRQGRTAAITIDLKPALDEKKLDARLLRGLDAHGKQQRPASLLVSPMARPSPLKDSNVLSRPRRRCAGSPTLTRYG